MTEDEEEYSAAEIALAEMNFKAHLSEILEQNVKEANDALRRVSRFCTSFIDKATELSAKLSGLTVENYKAAIGIGDVLTKLADSFHNAGATLEDDVRLDAMVDELDVAKEAAYTNGEINVVEWL